jgi:hypothetical protein
MALGEDVQPPYTLKQPTNLLPSLAVPIIITKTVTLLLLLSEQMVLPNSVPVTAGAYSFVFMLAGESVRNLYEKHPGIVLP